MNIELPTWIVRELKQRYPDLSTQVAIKRFLKKKIDEENNNNKTIRIKRETER